MLYKTHPYMIMIGVDTPHSYFFTNYKIWHISDFENLNNKIMGFEPGTVYFSWRNRTARISDDEIVVGPVIFFKNEVDKLTFVLSCL